MKGSLVRIDNRLVHGQILESWVPYLRALRIVVVNDEIAGDLFRESVIRMAVPRGIDVQLRGVDDFAGEQVAGDAVTEAPQTIIIFGSIDDVLRAYRLGFRFTALNVGNVQNNGDSKRSVGSHIRLSDDEIDDLMMLVRLGVAVEIRSVPRDKPEDFADVVKKAQ